MNGNIAGFNGQRLDAYGRRSTQFRAELFTI